MCGISGQVRFDKSPIDNGIIEKMLKSLEHRGRDDKQYLLNGNVLLAHNRLSIIDISESGRQPMVTSDGNLVIVFNGEIFNYLPLKESLISKGYRFKGTSDTEVLLYLWQELGVGCLEKIEGMYAFCIYDKFEDILWIVRDRMGIKPLYYYINDKALTFASEVKAILASGVVKPKLNILGLSDYLFCQSYLQNKTLFHSIESVEPGSALKVFISSGTYKVIKYWDFPEKEDSDINYSDAVEELKHLVFRAVKSWSISDVPMGSYLSGGIDSSTVAAIASSFSKEKLKTFSSIFNVQGYEDESFYSTLLAHHISSDHFKVSLSENEIIDDHKDLMYILDYPIAGYSAAYRTLSREVRKYCKVVLTGHGGDELFCGYPKYLIAQLSNNLTDNANGKANSIDLSKLKFIKFFEQQARNILGQSAFTSEYAILKHLFDRSYGLWDLINPDIKSQARGYSSMDVLYEMQNTRKESFLKKILYLDQKVLLPALLHVEDRTSMAENLESRTPLLDTSIVEFSYKMPESFFMQNSLKSLMRDVAKQILPEEIINNSKKSGIVYPVMSIFNYKMKHEVDKALAELDKTQLFIKPCHAIINNYNGQKDRVIWALWSLSEWIKSYQVSID
ncbi:asparagine synthase (glutamine-hydrolyzing) [Candidatus Megaera polyxenophila]|jgi:asparagine synthase (glutamine-hydrolysing)|uniref:asparagine synthase (glutamine-hydrolyzing) n=1 Tax=Candidatus Megaera polyxenophila TaxID=988779 RepID=UPI00249DDE58|nr:asparagine synthase (glutamine-hydrolyzing) [Candidatus Megaera polyxenophila]